MRSFRYLYFLVLLVPSLVQAAPKIHVGSFHDFLDEGRSTTLKRIRNTGDVTAFVKVSVFELVYDAKGKVREVDVEQMPVEERGVVASPSRLIVPAGGMQSVRLLYRGVRDKERYYRLRFVPVLPVEADGFAISAADAKQYEKSLSVGMQVMTGFGTLFIVRPNDVRYKTEVRQGAGKVMVVNEGNTMVALDNLRHCQSDGEKCGAGTKVHIRPGREHVLPEKAGYEYRFSLIEGDKKQEMLFKR